MGKILFDPSRIADFPGVTSITYSCLRRWRARRLVTCIAWSDSKIGVAGVCAAVISGPQKRGTGGTANEYSRDGAALILRRAHILPLIGVALEVPARGFSAVRKQREIAGNVCGSKKVILRFLSFERNRHESTHCDAGLRRPLQDIQHPVDCKRHKHHDHKCGKHAKNPPTEPSHQESISFVRGACPTRGGA